MDNPGMGRPTVVLRESQHQSDCTVSVYAVHSLPKPYILRVFVDIDRKPPYVVIVYRTSKIEKYWR